jgi:hypothetical protein
MGLTVDQAEQILAEPVEMTINEQALLVLIRQLQRKERVLEGPPIPANTGESSD